MNSDLKKRDAVDKIYKWDIESMFPDEALWQKDFELSLTRADEFLKYKGALAKDAHTLFSALKEKDAIWQMAEKVYVYARMRRDEDNTVDKYQAMADKCHSLLSKIVTNMSFFTPELLEIPEERVFSFMEEEKGLETYRHFLKSAFKEKAHILSPEEENILAQMGELMPATNDIFTLLNNADMDFGEITDEDGVTKKLTHGNYISFMESHNRDVRKSAYEKMYTAYQKLINTIATTYSYNTKTDVVSARIRKYPSALAASLSGDDIDESVYHNLIEVVNESLPALHKYVAIRKKLLSVDELKMYDAYVPLIELPSRDIPYEEAKSIITEALAPLGTDYVQRLTAGLDDGWVDIYENKGKTSGAYSFGSYDSKPFILMNYAHKLKDVFTLIHELGHSMHSLYTRESQPYIYGGHSIFTAEVASTVNESLLINYLLAHEEDSDMRKYLINMHIEEFRTTLFRQTMFAEFENITHKACESGESLTADWLCAKYEELNTKYFGPAAAKDEFIKYEWSRIPHFYNAFYVYQYATGYSAATAISGKILSEGAPARDDYLKFLITGESDYPVNLLKIAGVDMSSPEPIKLAMKKFESLVNEFEKLTERTA